MKVFFQRNDAIPHRTYIFEKAHDKFWFDKLDQLKQHSCVFAVIVFRHKENKAGLSMEIL